MKVLMQCHVYSKVLIKKTASLVGLASQNIVDLMFNTAEEKRVDARLYQL